MTEYCPVCLSKGKSTELKYLQINYTEATKMCPDIKCPYPLRDGYTDVFIKRDFMDLMKESKSSPNKNAAVPSKLKEHQNMKTNKEQSAINTPSSNVKATNSFEEFNNWFTTNDSVSDKETSSKEKLDDLSHLDMSNFSNELMELDFQDKVNDFDIDIDKLIEEEYMDLATNDKPSDTGLSGLNTPVNKKGSDINYISSVEHSNDTSKVIKDNNKKIRDTSLSNVGENKLKIPMSQSSNLKDVCQSGTPYTKIDISRVENIKSCSSQEGISKVNNKSVLKILKSQQIKLGNLGKNSQLIVVKCGANIQPPILTDMSKNVVSVTYIDKQNDQKTIYPHSSYKTLTSHQQQILQPPCKNAKKISNAASSLKKNKFEGLSIKPEMKGKSASPFAWNSITNNAQNVTLAKIEETKKQIGIGNDVQSNEKGSQVKRGQFEGFSFNEALKSISRPNPRMKKEIKLMRIQQSKLTGNKKTSESKSVQLEGGKIKGISGKIKNEGISEVSVNEKNYSSNSINPDDDWIKKLLL